jgi:hypothetical protein
MNLHYIRAAIMARTGIKLTIDEVKAYLLTEGMATQDKLNRYTFKGYDQYFGHVHLHEVVDLLKLADDLEDIRT